MRRFFYFCCLWLPLFLFSACSAAQSPPADSIPTPPTGTSQTGESNVADTDPPPSETPSLPSKPLHIPELTVELPRELDTTAAQKAMELLPAAMAEQQVTIDTVSVSFGPTYSATAAALRQGSVQLAFLPAADFVDLGCTTLLLADAYRTEDDTYAPGVAALICAGPSAYGQKIAADTSATWAELDQARWGVLSADSLVGYRCLRLWLEDNYEDNGVTDLRQVTAYDSWEDLLQAAAAEEIDLFPLPGNAELLYGDQWKSVFGGKSDFSADVQTISTSAGVCTWVIAAAPEDAAVNDPRFVQALTAVLNTLFSSSTEQKDAIGAEYYAPAPAQALNPLRRLLLSES